MTERGDGAVEVLFRFPDRQGGWNLRGLGNLLLDMHHTLILTSLDDEAVKALHRSREEWGSRHPNHLSSEDQARLRSFDWAVLREAEERLLAGQYVQKVRYGSPLEVALAFVPHAGSISVAALTLVHIAKQVPLLRASWASSSADAERERLRGFLYRQLRESIGKELALPAGPTTEADANRALAIAEKSMLPVDAQMLAALRVLQELESAEVAPRAPEPRD